MIAAQNTRLSAVLCLGVAFSPPSTAASDTENPAPRLSEIAEVECMKIGRRLVDVCVAWKSASVSVVRKAHCVEKRAFCAPPEN